MLTHLAHRKILFRWRRLHRSFAVFVQQSSDAHYLLRAMHVHSMKPVRTNSNTNKDQLSYLIPGLTDLELTYVKSQIRLILSCDSQTATNFRETYCEELKMPSLIGNKAYPPEHAFMRLLDLLDVCEIKDKANRKQGLLALLKKEKCHNTVNSTALQTILQRIIDWAHYGLADKRIFSEYVLTGPLEDQKRFEAAELNASRSSVILNSLLSTTKCTTYSDSDSKCISDDVAMPNDSNNNTEAVKNETIVGDVNALELLIQLNVADQLLHRDRDSTFRHRAICRGFLLNGLFEPNMCNSVPITVYYDMLTKIGFTNQEISEFFLLCFPGQHGSTILRLLSRRLRREFEWNPYRLVEEFHKRKEFVLNSKDSFCNGSTHIDLMIYMLQWHSVTRILSKSPKSVFRYRPKVGGQSRYLDVDAKIIPKTVMSDGVAAFLQNKVGLAGLRRIYGAYQFYGLYQKSHCIINLNFLEGEGFTLSQISRGAEVLMYNPTDLIEQVTALDQTSLDKNWRSRRTALAQVAYQIEKSQDFPNRRTSKKYCKPIFTRLVESRATAKSS